MAHYALINSNNIVVKVITGVNETETQTDLDGTQVGGSSEAWEAFYASQPEHEGLTCKRTSYSTLGGVHCNGGTPYRKNYAGPGFVYDAVLDAFYIPQPYPSWTLDSNCVWQPPTPKPTDYGKVYVWTELYGRWLEVSEPSEQ